MNALQVLEKLTEDCTQNMMFNQIWPCMEKLLKWIRNYCSTWKGKCNERGSIIFYKFYFLTERIGPAAALATLKIMEEEKSWLIVTEIGKSKKLLGQYCFRI